MLFVTFQPKMFNTGRYHMLCCYMLVCLAWWVRFAILFLYVQYADHMWDTFL